MSQHIVKPLPPVQRVPLDSVSIADDNANDHPAEQIAYYKSVLIEFGQLVAAVIDERRIVRKGTGLVIAMRELGATELDVIQAPLSEIQGAAFSLIDNKLAELSKRNYEKAATVLQMLRDDGFDIRPFGFKDAEIDPLLQADWKPPTREDLPTKKKDANPDVFTYQFNAEQNDRVLRAAELVKLREGDNGMSVSACIVSMADAYTADREE